MWFQIRSYWRNKLFSSFYDEERENTKPNQFRRFMIEKGEVLLAILVSKYECFKSLKKYVVIGKPYISFDLMQAGAFYFSKKAEFVLWSHKASVDDIVQLLNMKFVLMCQITLGSGAKHTITISSFEREKIVFQDPLGDVCRNYRLSFGHNIELSIAAFNNYSNNDTFAVALTIDPRERDKVESVKKLFEGKKYFYLDPMEYSLFLYSEDFTRIAFASKVINRSFTVTNIPTDLEGKIVYGLIISIDDNERSIDDLNKAREGRPTFPRKNYYSQRDN